MASNEPDPTRSLRKRFLRVLTNTFSAPPTESLLDKERSPPPRPIPLEFPEHVPPASTYQLTPEHMASLRSEILAIKRPTALSDNILGKLNIHFSFISMQQMVPAGFLDERPFLFDADLDSALTELTNENEDAYREILRQPPKEGKKRPKLAWSRNFFAGLEDMSRYWDDSQDQYYEIEVDDDAEEADPEARAKARAEEKYRQAKEFYERDKERYEREKEKEQSENVIDEDEDGDSPMTCPLAT